MLAILSGYDLAVVIVAAIVALTALGFGRSLSLSFRGMRASMERTESHTADIKSTVGETNGNGDITRMVARALGEIAEIRAELVSVNVRLDERTRVTRRGHTEPEELSTYTQDRMHDVLNALHRNNMMVALMWEAIAADYGLPDLATLDSPIPEIKNPGGG